VLGREAVVSFNKARRWGRDCGYARKGRRGGTFFSRRFSRAFFLGWGGDFVRVDTFVVVDVFVADVQRFVLGDFSAVAFSCCSFARF